MISPRWRWGLIGLAVVVAAALGLAHDQLPAAGANGLLHPARRSAIAAPPAACQDEVFKGDGLSLRGWRCRASSTRRGTLVYLHGIADNRPRVTAVVAAETFSDLRAVATERAPFFFTAGLIDQAFRIAEQQGGFDVDSVSPLASAAQVRVPVLLVHGAADTHTPPEHSRRVLAALAGPSRLILVDRARHNESLRSEVWDEVERWIDDVLKGMIG
jgi:fermentation-respiration switch protein FrsA (DUF1100 family)